MSMFRARVIFEGLPRTIEWNDGLLTGDQRAVAAAVAYATPATRIGPAGMATKQGAAILADPLCCFLLLEQVFNGAELVGGKLPTVPPLPPGAIG